MQQSMNNVDTCISANFIIMCIFQFQGKISVKFTYSSIIVIICHQNDDLIRLKTELITKLDEVQLNNAENLPEEIERIEKEIESLHLKLNSLRKLHQSFLQIKSWTMDILFLKISHLMLKTKKKQRILDTLKNSNEMPDCAEKYLTQLLSYINMVQNGIQEFVIQEKTVSLIEEINKEFSNLERAITEKEFSKHIKEGKTLATVQN